MIQNWWRVMAWAYITFEGIYVFYTKQSIWQGLLAAGFIWSMVTVGMLLREKDIELGRDAE